MKKILIDSSVRNHAAIGGTKRKSTGSVLWGGLHEIDTGHLETDVNIPNVSSGKGGPQAMAIGRLAQLLRDGTYQAFDSDALKIERSKHQSNKFLGKGYAGGTLLEGVKFTQISTLHGFEVSLPHQSPSDELRSYLKANKLPLFRQIWDALRSKKGK